MFMPIAKLNVFSLPGFGVVCSRVFRISHFSLNVLISQSEKSRSMSELGGDLASSAI